MNTVFVDTSAFVALNDSRDKHHDAAMTWLRSFKGRFVTSSDVIDETITRLRYDGGLKQAQRFRQQLEALEQRQRLSIVWRDRELHSAACEALDRFPDVALSFTDAVTVAVVVKRRCDAVFGFDQDFAAVGLVLVP